MLMLFSFEPACFILFLLPQLSFHHKFSKLQVALEYSTLKGTMAFITFLEMVR